MIYSFLSVFLLCALGAFGFSNSPSCNRGLSTRLHGIAEWRDFPSGITLDGENQGKPHDELKYGPSARRVPVVVVPHDQAVLQGEKKYFHFLSNDELRIFQQALDRNHGIFALGVLISEDNEDDDVIMNKLQLMEIKEYNMDLGVDFGIFCTAQAVGKAKLLSVMGSNDESFAEEKESSNQQLIAICEEHFDDHETYYSFEESNQMARDVLQIVKKLSEKEEQERRENASGNEHGVKILFDINEVNNEDTETEEEEVDEEEEQSRGDRFTLAYLEVLESDSHGYISNVSQEREGLLSWKEMNAISWAAFSSDLISSEEASMRLHAFDQDRITDRLKLASYWLADIFEGVEYGSNSRSEQDGYN